jgi:4-hydroxy-tetrahydrodipicolinate reductase
LIGTGRVGCDVARILDERPAVELVAATSRNPRHQGRDLGELCGTGELGVIVDGSPTTAVAESPDVVVIATTSFLDAVAPQIALAARAGCNVLVTAEEAAYPWAVDASVADELDRVARDAGVTILGAGANPGFVFDALVLTAAGATPDVTGIDVERRVNFRRFSATVLGRLGVGYDAASFDAGVRDGLIFGHIGFPQSMRVVAGALGRRIERIERVIEPVFADEDLAADHLAVPAGRTAGVRQDYTAIVDGEPWYRARLTGHVAPEAGGIKLRDTIEIAGSAAVNLVLEPGLDPQVTSASVLANSLRRLADAPPGWLTVADLPPARPS